MVTIQEYKDTRIKQMEKLMNTAGLQSFEISDAVREMAKAHSNLKDWAEKMSTWRDTITDANDLDMVDKIWEGLADLVENLMKKKHDKEAQKAHDDKKWWEDYYQKQQAQSEWWKKFQAGELDWQKDQKKRDEENKKKLDEYKENLKEDNKKFDEKNKKSYIADIEMDLIKKNVSGEQLSQRLGVSDWREKINGASDSWEALSRRSDLWDIIRELKSDNDKEFTCASCGEKKREYYNYPLEGGKKYCSPECWNKGEEKKKNNDSPAKNGGKFEHFSISDFFNLMKKLNAKEIRFDFATNQIIVEFNNGKSQQLDSVNSGLSSEQKQKLESELKTSQQPITFSQVSDQYNKKNNKEGNAGIIGAIVVVGIILAVVIGVVVYKSRKKDY